MMDPCPNCCNAYDEEQWFIDALEDAFALGDSPAGQKLRRAAARTEVGHYLARAWQAVGDDPALRQALTEGLQDVSVRLAVRELHGEPPGTGRWLLEHPGPTDEGATQMTGIITREERDELRRLWDAVRAIEGTTDEIPDKWQWECRGELEILGRTYWQTQPRYSDDDTRILYESEDEARLVAAMHNALPRLLDTIAAFEQAARVALHKIGQHRAGQYPDGQALEAAAYALSRVLTRSR